MLLDLNSILEIKLNEETLYMLPKKNIFLSLLFALILFAGVSSGITVEMENPSNVPTYLEEGEHVSFVLLIDNIDEDISSLTLETNLLSANSEPIYDFGDSNKYVPVNRYDKKMKVNLSSFPQRNFIRVSISGKAPSGEINHKDEDTGLVTTTFRDSKLKYYELKVNEEPYNIETFELRIKKKENFEKTMQSIEIDELDGLKLKTRDLFDKGLVTESQGIANEMSTIKLPNNLKMFGIVNVHSNLQLNIFAIVFLLIGAILGAILYSRSISDEDDDID